MNQNSAFAHTNVFFNARCKMILLILLASMLPWFLLSGCASMSGSMGDGTRIDGLDSDSLTQNAGKVFSDAYKNSDPSKYNLSKKILATAYTQFGKAYHFGGNSPETGFDCSGFVQWTFAQNGVNLPRDTKSLLGVGREVNINDIRPGDLVLFKQARSLTGRHAGIYIGDGKFIHSPSTGDRIKESSLTDGSYHKRLISVRRIINDPLASPLPDGIKDQIINKVAAVNTHQTDEQQARPAQSSKMQITLASHVEQKKPAAKQTVAAGSAKTAPKSKKTTKKYEIQKGDTIWTIAKKFGASENEIRSANNIREKQLLQIGQVITIPNS